MPPPHRARRHDSQRATRMAHQQGQQRQCREDVAQVEPGARGEARHLRRHGLELHPLADVLSQIQISDPQHDEPQRHRLGRGPSIRVADLLDRGVPPRQRSYGNREPDAVEETGRLLEDAVPVGLDAAGDLDQLEHRRRGEADPADEAADQPGATDLAQAGPPAIAEDGDRHAQAARPVVAPRRGHVEVESQDHDGEAGPPARGHGEDQPVGGVEPTPDRADDQPADQGQRRSHPVGVVPEQLVAPMPEPGFDGGALQPPEEEHHAHRQVQRREEGPIRYGRHRDAGAAQGRPEEADREETGEPVEDARRVARMRVGDHLHVRDAAAERPAQRTEHRELGGASMPVDPAGQEDCRQGRQRPGHHRPVFVAEIPANPPPQPEG